ncbi:UNVERIFIED_CONTAM: plasmodesmata callose-binding protein 1 [Sesamum radiatum]|uniref:Plasmodesmata callose-binding protein 1 n=1 Tax=Sesamum radiatum TaxID=300843 RepID=A0AAW2UB92_SESRA
MAAATAGALIKEAALLFLLCTATAFSTAGMAAATWCVARSDASDQALQTALDYACGAGADCAPIQSSGLCYLPNTLQAHASYAFNSYYQRKGNAPGSCSFAGSAAIARTDPSYGSCVYPSSPSTAGGVVPPGGTTGVTTTPGTTPIITGPPPPPGTTTPLYGSGGGSNPGMGPVIPDSPRSTASTDRSIRTIFYHATFLVVLSFVFPTM